MLLDVYFLMTLFDLISSGMLYNIQSKSQLWIEMHLLSREMAYSRHLLP
jgi:hypothetical protein